MGLGTILTTLAVADRQRELLAGSWDGDSIVRFDAETGEFLGVLIEGASNPHGLALGPDGLLYVSTGFVVQRHDPRSGDLVDTLIDLAAATGDTFLTGDIAFRGDVAYVHSWYQNNVAMVDWRSGDYLGLLIESGNGHGDAGSNMILGPDDRIYIPEWRRHTVNIYEADTGAFVGDIDEFISRAAGIDFDAEGTGFVGEYHTSDSLPDGVFAFEDAQRIGRRVRDRMRFGPQTLRVDDTRIYVGDQEVINVYDKQSGDRVDTFTPQQPHDNFFALLFVEVACDADLDGDGDADVDDFFTFLDLFAAGDDRADFNNDGTIDVDDFFAFLDAFAAGC